MLQNFFEFDIIGIDFDLQVENPRVDCFDSFKDVLPCDAYITKLGNTFVGLTVFDKVLKELFEEGDFVAEAMVLKFDGIEIAFVSLTAGFPVLFLVDMGSCHKHTFE